MRVGRCCRRMLSKLVPNWDCVDFSGAKSIENIEKFGATVFRDFVSVEEEKLLVESFFPRLQRQTWSKDHWDNAIKDYRELEAPIAGLSPPILSVVERIGQLMGSKKNMQQDLHVLELSNDGYIMPHVDSIKFCGDFVIGVNLLSPAIMELSPATSVDEKSTLEIRSTNAAKIGFPSRPTSERVRMFLPRRSAYVLTNEARFAWSHAVLGGENLFKTQKVERNRRIAIIIRDPPPH